MDEINSFSSNDILIDLNKSKTFNVQKKTDSTAFTEDLCSELVSIIKVNDFFFKETGVQTLCYCSSTFEWEYKSVIVKTPFLLFPISFSKNKIKTEITFKINEEEAFINPFIKNYFKKTYDLDLPEIELNDEYHSSIQNWINSINLNVKVSESDCLGNFHHHRFQIIKDLEGLIESEKIGKNVSHILGKEDVDREENLQFPLLVSDNLFPSDIDQISVFKQIEKSNTVIQGPPGTGKSQVLSNILGKILHSNYTALIVSEKRVALEVLQKKLSQFNLDDFTFITTNETVSNDFIISLKKTWERIEKTSSESIINLKLSDQKIQSLQNQLDLLNQKELIGEISFDEFMQLSCSYNLKKTIFISETPTIKEWQKNKSIIDKIFKKKLPEILSFFPIEVIKNEIFETFDLQISKWQQSFKVLNEQFNIKSYSDLSKAMKSAAICQIIENESNKLYLPVLNSESKEKKKYVQLKKKLIKIQNKSTLLENERQNWEIEPSENESTQLLEALKSTSYFKKRKAKKRISILTKSSFIEPVIALKNWLTYLEIEKELSKIKIEFSEIGIESIEQDLFQIDHLIAQINDLDWLFYSKISADERNSFCQHHNSLNQLNSVLKSYFNVQEETDISILLTNTLIHFEELIRNRPMIMTLDKASYKLIGKSKNREDYISTVLKSNWVKFESYFPELAKFKPEQIHSKIESIIKEQNHESLLFSKQIEQKILFTFKEFHQLLRTPAHKLCIEEKEKKNILRKGKAILVKEFAKSRNHPSIRELLQTDAAIWLNLLKPIWLSNPSQIAKCFPLTEGMFDLVIFDEASQIPLSNALGSLHRGKRIIVAGDEQQMSPTSYFKTNNQESVDLLHQSGFYWKNVYLKHHYRSVHPELIQFSNKHFYGNSLITYPTSDSVTHPIQLHHCSTGVYEERKNEEEAVLMAQLIEQKITGKKSIGIVAFSETQLKCIYDNLTPQTAALLNEKIEEGTIFFKALENVQGEECDQLVISLGYAKNLEGDFNMRFGPLNQKSGSKRLNVLLTRAKESIDFITSIKSTDFKISDNESINLLRLFIIQMEENSKNNLNQKHLSKFPYGLEPHYSSTSNTNICFPSIYTTLQNATELITFQNVLENRKWKVSY